RRTDAIAAGGTPSVVFDTVRGWTADDARPLPSGAHGRSVAILDITGIDGERPGGALFGTLVHAVLAQVPFEASTAALRDTAAIEARLLGLDADDATAA